MWQGAGETSTAVPNPADASRRDSLSNPYSVIASLSFEPQAEGSGKADKSPISDQVSPTKEASDSSTNMVDLFDRKQRMQEELETGILKFNLSPKKGLRYLADLGHLDHSAAGVARFLHQFQDRLDKTAVGDYLGREREYENGFCLQVLHEYVEQLDFSGIVFDSAIRLFLSGFRLPGEAQKIDRLMEAFAERYYLQNRDDFASADMAFILAFSTIMLQTNLHNPAIKDDKRMTKEQFIKQNKGISQDGELADALLIEIYDRILAQPISIAPTERETRRTKKDEPAGFSVFQSSVDKRRKEAFDDERKEMVRASEEMFKQSNRKENVFLRTGYDSRSDEAYARPMFEIVWPSVLGVLSQILETYDDPALTELCLSALRFSIRLACRLDIPVARNTFVNTLIKFTTLDSVRVMERKNLESVKVFVEIVLSEGDWLDEAWSPILQAVSQLARLQLVAEGSQADDVFFSDSASTVDGSSPRRRSKSFQKGSSSFQSNFDQFSKLFSGPSRAEVVREIEQANSHIILREVDQSLIDKIYVNSHQLGEGSVYHFVKALCEVSMLEISGLSSMTSLRGKDNEAPPRIFSLQKLVEVAEYNIGSRPRMVWAKIWTLLAKHFTTVCVHDNPALAMYAVDSLKQLSVKFLQKTELSNFNFQRVFLKPFEVIITHSKSREIKDLIVHCIDNMILACAGNIRSGWKSIFSIFEAASHDEIDIARQALAITDRLVLNNFDLLVNDFVELINCLVAYVPCNHSDLSMRALDLLALCSKHLVDGTVNPEKSQIPRLDNPPLDNATSQALDEESSIFRLWWPLLLGLSTAVGDQRLAVRVRALETLSRVLQEQGAIFSPQAWGAIFKGILFPMIDSAKTDFTPQVVSQWPTQNPGLSSNRQSWIGTTAISVFNVCIELFKEFEDRAAPVLQLADIMRMVEDCINQETETLSRLAVKVYHDLTMNLGKATDGRVNFLNDETADLVCTRICKCIRQNLCIDYGELGYLEFGDDAPSSVAEQLTDCPVQARRRNKDDSEVMQTSYYDSCLTPYGSGTLDKVGFYPFCYVTFFLTSLFSVSRDQREARRG